MPPKKKNNKVSLNDFLADSTLGSWADEMDSLPSAPAIRTDDDQGRDRYGRRGDDFLSSKPDRAPAPPREDLPLPTSPPYTAFVGNLAFDLTELELEDFFRPLLTKSVKIIRDRDDKPKGFGYVEFADLDGLKEALAKTGTSFSNRAVRISVAEPPKERDRPGFSGGDDDSKFDGPWRRDKPPGDFGRDSSRRRFDPTHERERLPSVSEDVSDWRSHRPTRPPPPETSNHDGPPPFRRRGSGFAEASAGLADSEEKWSIGSRFKPSSDESTNGSGSRFSGHSRVPHHGSSSPKEDEGDWRGSSRTRPPMAPRGSDSPDDSAPPTPQLGSRRKLELLPRSTTTSIAPSPVSSPRFSPATPSSKASPFGNAKPVDSLSREREIEDKIKTHGEKHTMSRNNSRTGSERAGWRDSQGPPASMSRTSSRTGTERAGWRDSQGTASTERGGGGGWRDKPAHSPVASEVDPPEREKPPVTIVKKVSTAPNVRPTLSFAKAARMADGNGEESEEKTE